MAFDGILMRRRKVSLVKSGNRRLGLEVLEPRWPFDASMLRITEIVASNDESLQDYDGDSSDWLEIFNPGVDSVDLGGMKLHYRPGDHAGSAFVDLALVTREGKFLQ